MPIGFNYSLNPRQSHSLQRHKQHQVNILLCLKKESEISFFGNSEKTVINGIDSIYRDEIGKEIVIIDMQMDNLVEQFTSD